MQVELRALTPTDKGALMDFHERCSDRTHYFRFFTGGKKFLRPDEAEKLCDVNQHERGAFVAVELGHPEIIHAVGRWCGIDKERAEIAFVVEDSFQKRGIGRWMFTAVMRSVKSLGYRKMTGDVLAENRGMRHLNRTCGCPLTEHNAGYGDVEFEIDLYG